MTSRRRGGAAAFGRRIDARDGRIGDGRDDGRHAWDDDYVRRQSGVLLRPRGEIARHAKELMHERFPLGM